MNPEEEGDTVLTKFDKLHTSIENVELSCYQKMTQPLNGNSSIIMDVFTDFLQFTNQENKTTCRIPNEQFEKWKEERFRPGFRLSLSTFKRYTKNFINILFYTNLLLVGSFVKPILNDGQRLKVY